MNRKRTNIPMRSGTSIILGLALVVFLGLAAGCEFGPRPPNPNCAPVSTQARPERWLFGEIEGQKLPTAHYAIFTTSNDRTLVTRLPESMESAYAQYCRLTGLPAEPDCRPMPVYVLADRKQWAAMTQQLTGPAAEAYLKIQNGGYSFQGMCVLWDLRSYATLSIAAHEGMHQFLYYRVKDALPAWVEEGLSSLCESCQVVNGRSSLEPDQNAIRRNDLHKAIGASRWIPLDKLLNADAGDFVGEGSGDYYAQLWALLLYIQSEKRYQEGFRLMVRQAAEGNLHKTLGLEGHQEATRSLVHVIALPAFERYINRDLRQFEKAYREYARKLSAEVPKKRPWYEMPGHTEYAH